MKPKWQRARYITKDRPELYLQELWVQGTPDYIETRNGPDPRFPDQPLKFLTNHVDEFGATTAISPERIELLPDFAEDVPLIPWKTFLANVRETHRDAAHKEMPK